MEPVSILISTLELATEDDAILYIAGYFGCPPERVKFALDIAKQLQNVPDFLWYTVYELQWIPEIVIHWKDVESLLEMFNYMNINDTITQKLHYILTQRALDPTKIDLSWRENTVIYPELVKVRDDWQVKLNDLISREGDVEIEGDITPYIFRPVVDIDAKYGITYAALGLLRRLQQYCENGGKCGNVMGIFAAGSSLECLKFLHEKGHTLDEHACGIAAGSGHLECLKYLRANGIPWNERTCRYAAGHGHLDCLRFARESDPDNPCPWNANACTEAAIGGHLYILKYLRESDPDNPCPWTSDAINAAASNGNLECLQYLFENGCPLGDRSLYYAATKGKLDCLKYLHEKGVPWDSTVCNAATIGGHLDCLKFANESTPPCPWDDEIYKNAAVMGHLECMQYIYACRPSVALSPINRDICSAIMIGKGRLDCLIFAHEHGSPWNNLFYINAVFANRVDCLIFAHGHGCPLDQETIKHLKRVLLDSEGIKYFWAHIAPKTSCVIS